MRACRWLIPTWQYLERQKENPKKNSSFVFLIYTILCLLRLLPPSISRRFLLIGIFRSLCSEASITIPLSLHFSLQRLLLPTFSLTNCQACVICLNLDRCSENWIPFGKFYYWVYSKMAALKGYGLCSLDSVLHFPCPRPPFEAYKRFLFFSSYII